MKKQVAAWLRRLAYRLDPPASTGWFGPDASPLCVWTNVPASANTQVTWKWVKH